MLKRILVISLLFSCFINIYSMDKRRYNDDRGNTPLHVAVLHDDIKSIEDHCQYIFQSNNVGQTALHLALLCRRHNQTKKREIIRLLLKMIKYFARDKKWDFLNKLWRFPNGRMETALHMAINLGLIDIAIDLIEAGANITIQDHAEHTLLHLLLLTENIKNNNDRHQLLCYILEKINDERRYAFLNKQDNNGATALHIAISRGYLDIAKMLIQGGADVMLANNKGLTILHILFCKNEKLKCMIKYMIKNIFTDLNNKEKYEKIYGHNYQQRIFAFVNQQGTNRNGEPVTALHLAMRQSGCRYLKELLQSWEFDNQAIENFIKGESTLEEVKNYFKSPFVLMRAKINGLDTLIQQKNKDKITFSDLQELYKCVSFDEPELIRRPSWYFAFYNDFYDCKGRTVRKILLENSTLLIESPQVIPYILSTSACVYNNYENIGMLIAPEYYNSNKHKELLNQRPGEQNVLAALLQARQMAKQCGQKAFGRALFNAALWLLRVKKIKSHDSDFSKMPIVPLLLMTSYINPNFYDNLYIIGEKSYYEHFIKNNGLLIECDEEGLNHIHEMIIKGQYRLLEIILKYYTEKNMLFMALMQDNITSKTYQRRRPIQMILLEKDCVEKHQEEVIKVLLNTRNEYTGRTLLEQAQRNGDIGIAKDLQELQSI